MSRYTDAVERELEGLTAVSSGLCPGCEQCASDKGMELDEFSEALECGEIADEPSFSWSRCECCGSSLGGDRHPAHAITGDGQLIHFEICVDCLFYLAYGDEPENWGE